MIKELPQTDLDMVKVKTTLPSVPYPPSSERPAVLTERLIIRPFTESDAEALHTLRTDPEVMQWTALGETSPNLDDTKEHMATFLPPNDTRKHSFGIFLVSTGEFVGRGGSHKRDQGELGWPVLGYMFKKEFWGKGFATEFVKAYLGMWWALPRSEEFVEVDSATIKGGGCVDVEGEEEEEEECLVAVTVTNNPGSHSVLRKCGFEMVKVWEEDDIRDPTQKIKLYGWVAKRPKPE